MTEQPITEPELRRGLRNGELAVHYQPQVNLTGRKARITGAEALLRWHHPTRGMLLPDRFIPLADATGLIDALTAFVAAEAIEQGARWRRAGFDLTIAINLSARSLTDLELPDALAALTSRFGFEPAHLTVEITETGDIAPSSAALDVLARLRLKGFALSIDDFGTGYSTLARIQRIPFDELKIDKLFLAEAETDARARIIVRRIIDLGRDLGLRVVVEGIETAAALKFLRTLDCGIAQSFLLGRPRPAKALDKQLARRP